MSVCCVDATHSLQVPFYEWSLLPTAVERAEYLERKFQAAADTLLPALVVAEQEAREAAASDTSNRSQGILVDTEQSAEQLDQMHAVSKEKGGSGSIKQDTAPEEGEGASNDSKDYAASNSWLVKKDISQVSTQERLRVLAAAKVLKPQQSRVGHQGISRSSAGALKRPDLLKYASKLTREKNNPAESAD